MPSVPFCNLNDAFGITDWEKNENKNIFQTFKNASECNERNNKFQNAIAQNQFGRDATRVQEQNSIVKSRVDKPLPGHGAFNGLNPLNPDPQNKLEYIRPNSPVDPLVGQRNFNQDQQYQCVMNEGICNGPNYPSIKMYPNIDPRVHQYHQVYSQYPGALPYQWFQAPYQGFQQYYQPTQPLQYQPTQPTIEHFGSNIGSSILNTDSFHKISNILVITLCVLFLILLVDIIRD